MLEKRSYDPQEIRDEILLSLIDGIGPITTRKLLNQFGTAKNIFTLSPTELKKVNGIGDTLADQIVSAPKQFNTDELIDLCQRNTIQIISENDQRYPQLLREIPDPPPILYAVGNRVPADDISVAIVGTRGYSIYGQRQATTLSHALAAAGITIVSGLALGIDGFAHQAALRANGRTIAVIGSGLLNIYPPHHRELAHKIVQNGVLYSEFPPLTTPVAGNFPRRNRIVSGISLGVLVIESAVRGGSLITARLAMEQNREVFAVPGPIDSENSRGCHQLIKDGAILVDSHADIIDQIQNLHLPKQSHSQTIQTLFSEMDNETEAEQKQLPKGTLNKEQERLYSLIQSIPLSIDDLIEQTGFPAQQVMMIIGSLEMKRLIIRTEGGKILRR